LAIPQERLEMKEEFLSRLVKLTSLENGRSYLLSKKDHGASDGFRGNQYEIEVVKGQDDLLAEPTKNIYVYPIANYYKNVLDEKNDPEVSDWLFTC